MVEGWLTGWRRAVLAAGLGAVAALGQAPWGFWWATLGALAALAWYLGRMPDTRAAFWSGLLAGAGYFALALNWIVEPFLIDIARHGWMAPFAVILLSFGLGLFWGAAAVLGRWFAWPALGFVVAFVALEWVRGVIFTGFPWAMVGHVWIGTPVDQLAALGGPTGLSLLTLLAASLPVLWRWRGAGLRLFFLPELRLSASGGWANPCPNRFRVLCGWCSPMLNNRRNGRLRGRRSSLSAC